MSYLDNFRSQMKKKTIVRIEISILQNAKFHLKRKKQIFGTKIFLFWNFYTAVSKTVAVFEISSLEFEGWRSFIKKN